VTLLERLPPAVARCVAPHAPEHLRRAAAQGALPLPPVQRLCSLTLLLSDPSEGVRSAAREAWTALPPGTVDAALGDATLPEGVLHLVATSREVSEHQVLRVLEHPAVGPLTLIRLGTSDNPRVLSRIAGNQRVLDRHPEVARALLGNPLLDPGESGRLVSLYALEEPAAEEPEPAPAAEPADLPADLPAELLEEPDTPGQPLPGNLYQYVQSLTVGDKLKLAMTGSKGARQLLIRDTNKVVSTAVIRSPKIREDEVQIIAQDRTVSEEILRIILTRKDWLKNYPIRLALTQNPKTPLPRALRLLDTLQERDLRQIGKSRNVATAIRLGAARILAKRGKL
jgi:hypothetical protein